MKSEVELKKMYSIEESFLNQFLEALRCQNIQGKMIDYGSDQRLIFSFDNHWLPQNIIQQISTYFGTPKYYQENNHFIVSFALQTLAKKIDAYYRELFYAEIDKWNSYGIARMELKYSITGSEGIQITPKCYEILRSSQCQAEWDSLVNVGLTINLRREIVQAMDSFESHEIYYIEINDIALFSKHTILKEMIDIIEKNQKLTFFMGLHPQAGSDSSIKTFKNNALFDRNLIKEIFDFAFSAKIITKNIERDNKSQNSKG